MRALSNRVALALAAALVIGAVPSPHRTPETNYMLHCQGCHRPDGSGVPGAVPAFPGQVGKFLKTPAGRAYLVRVPGAANAPISDEDLADLLGWIVRRFDPGNVPADFADYSGDEVAKLRRQTLQQVAREREAVLAELARLP